MKADEKFKALGFEKLENKVLHYIEYTKKEKNGDLCVSIITYPTISVDIRMYQKENPLRPIPQAIYVDELEALYLKVKELKSNEKN